MKRYLKKIANYLLTDRKVVHVDVNEITYGNLLKGKNIVITGGGSGIGLAMAKKFVKEGASVIIVGRNENKLKDACCNLGPQSSYVVFDITQFNTYNDLFNTILSINPVINAFICNAGLSLHEGGIENVTEEGYQSQMDVNLKANYFLCKKLVEYYKQKSLKALDILLISSITSNQPYDLPYGMSKSALNSMVQKLNHKYYSNGIRVNAIAPGIIPTEITKDYVDVSDGNMFIDEPCGRYFLPSEIAEVATFLLSGASKIIGGEVINCDGGQTQKRIW